MKKVSERLAYKITEGYQAPSLSDVKEETNIFYRKVKVMETGNLSFILGMSSSGLRTTAYLDRHMLLNNINSITMASRWHLPLIINTSIHSSSGKDSNTHNFYNAIRTLQSTGCFQFVAFSAQEEIYLTLIACRVSELSLIPGMVIADFTGKNKEIPEFPSDKKIRTYLGNPDDQIECPTPAQQIIFGTHRRRVPSWYNYDTPVQLGSLKNSKDLAYENAARIKFFQEHLEDTISQAFSEFNDIFDIDIEPVSGGLKNPAGIISYSGRINEMFHEKGSDLDKTDFIQVRQIHPLPKKSIKKFIEGRKSVTVLEDSGFIASGHSLISSEIADIHKEPSLKFYSAGFSPDLTYTALAEAAKHMLQNEIQTNYYLGLSFFNSSSNYPKQEIHYQDIKSKYPQLEQESVQGNDNFVKDNPILKDELPETVKTNQNTGPIFTRLSHFYETSAFFRKYNIHSELVADPFSSTASMPASSAELFSPQNERNLPGFLPENCTACGNCYMTCPHSALPPIAIGVEDLLKSGAELAKSCGNPVKKLFPHYKNLSRLAAQSASEINVSTVSDLVKPAFEKLCDKLNLKETDKDILDQDFYFIMEQIGDFPISLNDVLYNIPSNIEAGSGKLFSIVVNPMSCTGCGLCQEVCEDNAIEMLQPKDQNINKVFSEFRAWEQMPDTETKTINQLHLDENVNSLAAILLSRNYYTSMSGFGPDESENASKTIMHLLSAITEANVQPGVISQLNYIDKLSSDLTDSVHKELSDALPDDDITELSEVLKNTPKKKILVRDIIDNIRADTASNYINTQSLGRKIELIKSLKELYQLIKIGSRGNGKSRYGLVIASKDKFNWAGTYPFNHFSGPSIILQDENSAEFILGLMSGQIRFLLDQIKLLRRANLEIKGKYDPVIHDQQIAQLEWDDLTEDEKSYLPPVFMLIDHKGMSSVSRSSFLRLLTYKVPVKVLSFDSATCHPLTSKEDMTQRHSMFMSNLALTDVYIYQGSLVNADRFFEGISVGIKNSKPAFFNLFVPDNSQLIHNDKNILELSKLVENSRMLPDYSYLKIKSDNNFNVLLETDWNTSSEKNWPQIELGSDGNTITYELSWADWAFQQKAWQREFEIQEDTSDLIPVTEYLNLKTAEKKGKTPIIKVFESEEVHSYSVSSLVIEMTEMVLDQWREIQRMVDKLSDFPDQLKEQVRKELSKELNEEIIKIEKEYEQKLEDQKEKQKKELRKTLKEKLLMLSKMKKGNKTV